MAMEMFLPAILSDLLDRSVSFVVQRYRQQSSVEDSIQQLHLALLRVSVTVEEAEGRHITNRAMLRQLDVLREAMYGGYYMLDALTYGRSHGADAPPPPCRFSSALSRLNSAKRLCFNDGGVGSGSGAELRRMVDRLGSMIADMKEFVVFLSGYPRVCRQQPYSAHLLLEKFMFGRQKEMEQIVSFLLGAESNGVGVLPVVGPARVGKSTLVEHVCHDERVRNHFSSILRTSGDDLEVDEKLNDPGDHGLIKHRGHHAARKSSLVILELADDEVPDEGRWRRLCSSAFCKGIGSKIIVTSRSEAVERLGTEHALRLKCLNQEAYWYYFKTLAFGSANPEGHPKLHGHLRGGEGVVHRRQHCLQLAQSQPRHPVLVQHPAEHEGVHGEAPPPVRQAPARPPAEEPACVPLEAGPDVQSVRRVRLLPGVPCPEGGSQDNVAGGPVREAGASWEVRGSGVEITDTPLLQLFDELLGADTGASCTG